MTIQTLKHQYYVLRKLRTTETLEQYLCQEESRENQGQLYDIFQIRERELVIKLILYVTQQAENQVNEDFFEYFSKDGQLYLVFLHKDAVSLEEKLKTEECTLKERIVMGRKILERILLLDMPDLLVHDVLCDTNIQVTPALDIHFWYSLNEVSALEDVTISAVQARMADVFKTLFQRELKLQVRPEIPAFLERMHNREYEDYGKIYQEYQALTEILENNFDSLKPNSFLFRVWDKIKKIYKVAKPVLVVALVLLLAGYLLYSILNPAPTTSENYNFQRIGTLKISEEEK